MSQRISTTLRKKVATRASFRCEYCRLPEEVCYHSFHVDHIRSIKHGGKSVFENLAFSCSDCNIFKGSDIATFIKESNVVVRFFNPRLDNWFEHFEVFEGAIYPKTEIGAATINIFQLNIPDRIILRQELTKDGLYP